MLVKFNRRHRFYRAGQVLDIPARVARAWASAGIVSLVRPEPSGPEEPENKAVLKSRRTAAGRGRAGKD